MYLQETQNRSVVNTRIPNAAMTLHSQTGNGICFHDPVIEQTIFIRLADNERNRSAAKLLLNRMYSWRGYGSHHEIAQSPSHTTFTASSDAEMLGTITLAIDSPKGLAVDVLFKDIIDQYRARPGGSVCELTKFAFDTSKPSKPMLASLFHLIFIYGYREYGCTDLFIEVNPRHVRFYERMLGFQRIGELKTNSSVAAPSQLMWLSVKDIRDQINACAGLRDNRKSPTLYNYFFSPEEEEGLYMRMVRSQNLVSGAESDGRPGFVQRLFAAIKPRASLALSQRSGRKHRAAPRFFFQPIVFRTRNASTARPGTEAISRRPETGRQL